MALTLVTTPTAEPLHRDEVKNHLREDETGQDVLIDGLILAARERIEALTRRALVNQTWDLRLDGFPNQIILPRPPLMAVSSVQYVDSDGTTQTLATTEYTVDAHSEPARIVEAWNKTWPTTRDHIHVVTVRFVAGYATDFTVNSGTDVVTAVNHQFSDGDVVRLYNTGDPDTAALPAGLSADTDYFVRDTSGDTLKLAATSGGSAIDITGAGTGTHFVGVVPRHLRQAMLLLITHWYEQREAYSDVRLLPVPDAVQALVWQDRVFPERLHV